MPDSGVHDGASAQASLSAEVDAVELFERLREEIRRGGAGPEGARATWRAQAERMWAVASDCRSLRALRKSSTVYAWAELRE